MGCRWWFATNFTNGTMNPLRRISCVGDLMIECMPRVTSFPPPGTTLVVDPVRREIGGAAFNICYYLRQLGFKPRLIASYGQYDRLLVEKACVDSDLEIEDLVQCSGATDFLLALLTDQEHCSVYVRGDLCEKLAGELLQRAKGERWLVLAGSRHPTIRNVFVNLAAEFAGDCLAFNPSYAIFEYSSIELNAVLGHSHVVLFNEQEALHAMRLLGLADEDDLARHVSGILIITLGRNGLRYYASETVKQVPVVNPVSRNVIGAGDAFFAGFLWARHRGENVNRSIAFGSAVAQKVVESDTIRVKVSEADIVDALN